MYFQCMPEDSPILYISFSFVFHLYFHLYICCSISSHINITDLQFQFPSLHLLQHFLSHKYYRPAISVFVFVFHFSAGGIELSAKQGRIKVTNTLESRLCLLSRQVGTFSRKVSSINYVCPVLVIFRHF